MENTHPHFWAVLPAGVRYDKKIGSTAKLLYAEITALSNQEGYCWASNDYFSKVFNVSITQVSRLIKELEDNGFIRSSIDNKSNNKRKIYPIFENIKKEKKSLGDLFLDLVGDVSSEWVDEKNFFIDFWTEKNINGKKERWELQKVFDVRKRWATWQRNKVSNFGKGRKEVLPTDKEIREKRKKEIEEMEKEKTIKRSPDEQEEINKKLDEMKKNLTSKFNIRL